MKTKYSTRNQSIICKENAKTVEQNEICTLDDIIKKG